MYEISDFYSSHPMDRDIGTSFYMAQSPMMMPMMGGMGYGLGYGAGIDARYLSPRLKVAPAQDTYVKMEQNDVKDKGKAKKIIKNVALGTIGTILLFKLPIRSTFKALKSGTKWATDWIKYGAKNVETFFKGLNIPKAP